MHLWREDIIVNTTTYKSLKCRAVRLDGLAALWTLCKNKNLSNNYADR